MFILIYNLIAFHTILRFNSGFCFPHSLKRETRFAAPRGMGKRDGNDAGQDEVGVYINFLLTEITSQRSLEKHLF